MSWQIRKQKVEQRAQKIADMKQILTTAEAREPEKRSLTKDEDAQFDKLHGEAEALAKDIERLDQVIALEAAEDRSQNEGDQPGGTIENRSGRQDLETADDEQTKKQLALQKRSFDRYLRSGIDALSQEERTLLIHGVGEQRAAIVKSDQGVVGPRQFGTMVIDALKDFAGVIEAGAEQYNTATGNDFPLPTGDDTSNTGRLVGEGVENSNDTNPTLGNATMKAYRFDSDWIKVSNELLEDAGYDVEGYIRRKANERIGRAFNTYATTGTGTNQPKGVVTASTLGKALAATNALTYEEILDLIHSIDPAYRKDPSCRLMMHDTTLLATRKLQDDAGQYIFARGAQGSANTIDGYQYIVNNAMDNIASGASKKVMLFGAFERYKVRNVTTMRIIRAVEKFAEFGVVGFLVTSRHDGLLADTAAIKHMITDDGV